MSEAIREAPKIGFTTTIPVEILFAGGYTPCDLNNVFIADPDPMHYIARADQDGFPNSVCNWIKGIYGVVMEGQVDTVITVMEGDCSNTQALADILRYKGIRTIPFSYPFDRDRKVLGREIRKLMETLSVDRETLKSVESGMASVRAKLSFIDRMTYADGQVTGYENHLWLVRSSDMLGNILEYDAMAAAFIEEARKREKRDGLRLGYIGVPPIVSDLHEFVESLGVQIVYNETQRQFSLPFSGKDIVKRYLNYTYPYGIFARLDDMKREIKRRAIDGIIHYVQAFCFRAMEDVILRETIGVPVINVEGDLPKPLDARSKLRLEAFVEMVKGKNDGKG
jgi:benzoyl-CoA reductase/2-hydroxyglutaryl-CoA dehydratase subunit BcrC/BadD/HgdB